MSLVTPRRPLSRGRLILLSLFAFLILRETGLIDVQCTFHETSIKTHPIISSHPPQWDRSPMGPPGPWIPLKDALSDDTTITYSETRGNPVARWIPLYKTGWTTINRAFIVTRNNTRILEGTATWHIHLTAAGILSARAYAKIATPTDKEFRDAIAKELSPRLAQSH